MQTRHNTVHHGQPQPSALTRVLGSKKRFEYVLDHFRTHTMAGIADAQLDIGTLLDSGNPGCSVRVEVDIGERNSQNPASFPHGMAGVGADVHDHLMDLSWISHYQGITGKIQLELDVFGCRRPQQFKRLFHDLIHSHRPQLEFALFAEGQDLSCKVPGALDGAIDGQQIAAKVRSFGSAVESHLRVAKHDGQDVVEVMSDASGQCTDGFHFLRMQQLRLQFLALADIHDDAAQPFRLIITPDDRRIEHRRKSRPILSQCFDFQHSQGFSIEQPLRVFHQFLPLFRHYHVERTQPPLQILTAVPKAFKGLPVAKGDATAHIHFEYGFRQQFRQLSKPFFALLQCSFAVFESGDVNHIAHQHLFAPAVHMPG